MCIRDRFAEASVEGPEKGMASFERDGEDKAIGEAELGMRTKVSERGGDDIRILNGRARGQARADRRPRGRHARDDVLGLARGVSTSSR